ncbi:hypothetical protein P7C70_g7732, partial [Phenoliferia sp. Uapishka_3]
MATSSLPTITALPESTRSLLRSSVVIPSLPSVLLELVQNSLDARATSINVFVNLDRWSIKCEDDGCGFSREELGLLGRERYWTSKVGADREDDVETFGFRGEALASLADIALLEVLTKRERDGGESYSLVVKGGKLAFEGVAKTKRTAGGTTVWARDIFYKVCLR